jgi:hypothetical protein
MSKFATIADALRALPEGPDAIAEHLAGLNVKARCADPGRCAIAQYLVETVVLPAGVSVGPNDAGTFSDDDMISERIFYADIGRPEGGRDGFDEDGVEQNYPTDISEFIAAFDAREYPAPSSPRR